MGCVKMGCVKMGCVKMGCVKMGCVKMGGVNRPGFVTALQVAPLTLLLVAFVVVPLAAIVVVSFLDYDSVQILPRLVWGNYSDLIFSRVTWLDFGQFWPGLLLNRT